MPKVSILMNCYNGEKYLKQAIDSVYDQTFKEWEIVFIDNCSTDNSAQIAKSYGEKVKYYKTDHNIPLGAARKFGVNYCNADYIAVLDTDDIWLPYALEKLYDAIISGDFALAYGNQNLINSDGESIGKIQNVYAGEEGDFFPKLLKQFDIPMVATMINKNKLFEAKLNFDENIYGSEEYCLFMQLAVENNFIAINDFIVNYRVHESLSTKLNDKIYKEREYTLKKILTNHPNIEERFDKEFTEAFARGVYYKVQYLMSKDKKIEAFNTLRKYMFVDYRYFILTLMTLLPKSLWNIVQSKKYKR